MVPSVSMCKQGGLSQAQEAASRTSSASTAAPSDQFRVATSRTSSASTADASDSNDFDFSGASAGHWPVGWEPLHAFFNHVDVQRWEKGRFRMERMIQRAPRNKGQVDLMLDAATGMHVAVKKMPNSWVCERHELFAARHRGETERPWVDIGCCALLTSLEFPYVCPLLGVYQSSTTTRVVTELAGEGDLFEWSVACKQQPGRAREALVRPLARQLMDAVRLLHDLSIIHRDISAENVVLSRRGGELQIQLVDFGMATRKRFMRGGGGFGKPAHRAPEAHTGEVYDGFLMDGFAVGVLLFTLLIGENPWVSTCPGACKAFSFLENHGFRAFAARRKCFQQQRTIAQCLSEPALQVLDGLLSFDPADRITLGENTQFIGGERPSVWELPWLDQSLQSAQ